MADFRCLLIRRTESSGCRRKRMRRSRPPVMRMPNGKSKRLPRQKTEEIWLNFLLDLIGKLDRPLPVQHLFGESPDISLYDHLKITAAIGMMRIRFAYECGRDAKVKSFVEKARLMNYLKGTGNSREEFIKLARYMWKCWWLIINSSAEGRTEYGWKYLIECELVTINCIPWATAAAIRFTAMQNRCFLNCSL